MVAGLFGSLASVCGKLAGLVNYENLTMLWLLRLLYYGGLVGVSLTYRICIAATPYCFFSWIDARIIFILFSITDSGLF